MQWRKLGRVYCPTGQYSWAKRYAHLPTPVLLEAGKVRVYFAGLDTQAHGRIGYVDVAASDPTQVLYHRHDPVLQTGAPGHFDDSGVNPSCVLRVGDVWRLYYIGWQRSERVPYALFSGVAESSDGEVYQKRLRVPVLDRTDSEPFVRSAPCVLAVTGGFRAWYVSALDWIEVGNKPYPRYVVRAADSSDGLLWGDDGPICINLRGDEFGIGRPWVICDAGRYRMWYSIRSKSHPYRVGYAESDDGLQWNRMDDCTGICASASGWDAEMICYAAVIDADGQRLMFYNGNRHGATGFGVAVLEEN